MFPKLDYCPVKDIHAFAIISDRAMIDRYIYSGIKAISPSNHIHKQLCTYKHTVIQFKWQQPVQ